LIGNHSGMKNLNYCYIHIPKSAGSSIWNGWMDIVLSVNNSNENVQPILIDDIEHRLLKLVNNDIPNRLDREKEAYKCATSQLFLDRRMLLSQKLVFHIHRPLAVAAYIDVDCYILPMRNPVKRLFSHLNDIYVTATKGDESFEVIRNTNHFCPDVSREMVIKSTSYTDLMTLLSYFMENYVTRFMEGVFSDDRLGAYKNGWLGDYLPDNIYQFDLIDAVLNSFNKKLFIITFDEIIDSTRTNLLCDTIDLPRIDTNYIYAPSNSNKHYVFEITKQEIALASQLVANDITLFNLVEYIIRRDTIDMKPLKPEEIIRLKKLFRIKKCIKIK
jgi:hypothetical protein